MDYRNLGRSGIKVSSLCLGTMTWGEQNSEAEGHAQMDYATEHGINFFDTAELYPIPPKPGTQGRTEEIIGSWFKARGKRDDIVLATKVVGRSVMEWFRDDKSPARLTRGQIMEAVEKSLTRLQTDYIDLYQLHWPDRPLSLFGALEHEERDGDSEPIEEILSVLGDLVTQGKVRTVGLSNETPWGVMQFLRASETQDLPRVASIQNAYNLVNRVFEIGLSEITYREDVGLLAYSPMAQGFLSGKYLGGARPAGARVTLFGERMNRYNKINAEEAFEAYVGVAKKHGLDPAQMALQFVTMQPFVTSNIIGATTLEQLKADISSIDLVLDEDVLKDIDAVHRRYPNPCP